MKQIISLVLCLSVLLTLAGCAQSEPAATTVPETAAPAPTETVDPAQALLAEAQNLIDGGKLTEAETLLAPLDGTDPRVAELLDKIEAGKQPIDLKITLSYDGPNGKFPQNVQIHGVTAQAVYPGTVRYTVDYTAPGRTPIRLSGGGISEQAPKAASGQREQLVFEIPEADVRAMGGIFRMEFRFAQVIIGTQWPGEGYENLRGKTVDVPLHLTGELKGAKCEIHGLSVQPLSKDQLIYTLDYTPSKNGICFNIWFSDGTYLKQDAYTDHSRTQAMMIVDRAVAGTNEKLYLSFASSPYREPTLFGEAVLSEYELPEYTFSEAELASQPEKKMEYQVGDDIRGDIGVQIHSVTAQPLDNGYVRVRVDDTAMPDVGVVAYAFVPAIKNFLDWTTAGGREQKDIYLPQEDFERMNTLEVAYAYYDAQLDDYTGYYIIHISTGDSSLPLADVRFPGYDPEFDEEALTEPAVELRWEPDPEDTGDLDVTLFGGTVQNLGRGVYRLRLEYQSPEKGWAWVYGLAPGYKEFEGWGPTGNREHRDIYISEEDYEKLDHLTVGFYVSDGTRTGRGRRIRLTWD